MSRVRHRAVCDCGNPATVPGPSGSICARCREMERAPPGSNPVRRPCEGCGRPTQAIAGRCRACKEVDTYGGRV